MGVCWADLCGFGPETETNMCQCVLVFVLLANANGCKRPQRRLLVAEVVGTLVAGRKGAVGFAGIARGRIQGAEVA